MDRFKHCVQQGSTKLIAELKVAETDWANVEGSEPPVTTVIAPPKGLKQLRDGLRRRAARGDTTIIVLLKGLKLRAHLIRALAI